MGWDALDGAALTGWVVCPLCPFLFPPSFVCLILSNSLLFLCFFRLIAFTHSLAQPIVDCAHH